MLNDPPPSAQSPTPTPPEQPAPPVPAQPQRRPHPLELKPSPRPTVAASADGMPRQQVMLHIPVVKPTVTVILVGVMVALFLVRAVSPELDSQLIQCCANNGEKVLVEGEYLRLFTSIFLHASVFTPLGDYSLGNSLHLVFNAYLLYLVGTSIEPYFGHTRFKLIFALAGITGSIVSVALSDLNTYSLGASGAVFGLIGAEAVFTYRHRKLLGARGQARLRWLVSLGVINLIFGAVSGLGLGGMRIDNWAHIGGLAGGLILTWFIGPDLTLKRHPEREGALIGEDVNPLRRGYRAISLFVSALLVILIVAVMLVR